MILSPTHHAKYNNYFYLSDDESHGRGVPDIHGEAEQVAEEHKEADGQRGGDLDNRRCNRGHGAERSR